MVAVVIQASRVVVVVVVRAKTQSSIITDLFSCSSTMKLPTCVQLTSRIDRQPVEMVAVVIQASRVVVVVVVVVIRAKTQSSIIADVFSGSSRRRRHVSQSSFVKVRLVLHALSLLLGHTTKLHRCHRQTHKYTHIANY